jgi:integrase
MVIPLLPKQEPRVRFPSPAPIFRSCLFPLIGDLPIQEISSSILKAALKPIEARGKLDLLADALRISKEVFNLAKSDDRYIGDNPAEALKTNIFPKHRGQNRKALPWAEMNGFLHRLDAGRLQTETTSCIKLLMTTGTRPGESREARWAEFDLEAAKWTIPAERMKSRKEHCVPLSVQTVAMLKELHLLTGEREYLFPGQRGSKAGVFTDMGLLKAIRVVAGHDLVDAHGFRATFRTYAEESGKWSFEVMEAALAHGKKTATIAAYARATHYAERAKLAQWYADELDQAKRGAIVVQMKVA